MEVAARIGWFARAALYALVAVLLAGIRSPGGGREVNKEGAFEAVAGSPYGRWILSAIVVGMIGFAVWRAWSAVRGTEEKPNRRLGWAVSAAVYTVLAVLALGVLLGRGSGSGSEEQTFTARVMEWPGGPFVVGAVALGILAVAANYVRKGVKERFLQDVDEGAVPEGALPAVRVIGVVGWLGRALVWGIVGWFLLRAAVQHDPSEPVGLDRSLRKLAEESWGATVLWVAFGGLVAYAVLCVATALWPDPEPES